MTVINGIVIVLVVVIMTEISRIVIGIGVSNGSDDDNGDKERDAAGAGWEQDVGNHTTHRVINQVGPRWVSFGDQIGLFW